MKTPEPERGSLTCYTPAEVAKMFRVSRNKVAEWIDAGDMPAINISEGKIKPRYRIEQAAIEAFKVKRAAVPIEAPPPPPREKPFKRRYLGPRVSEE